MPDRHAAPHARVGAPPAPLPVPREPLWGRAVSAVFLGSVTAVLILLGVADLCTIVALLLR